MKGECRSASRAQEKAKVPCGRRLSRNVRERPRQVVASSGYPSRRSRLPLYRRRRGHPDRFQTRHSYAGHLPVHRKGAVQDHIRSPNAGSGPPAPLLKTLQRPIRQHDGRANRAARKPHQGVYERHPSLGAAVTKFQDFFLYKSLLGPMPSPAFSACPDFQLYGSKNRGNVL
jgi:hypothetical protein